MNKTNLSKYYPRIYKNILETDNLVFTENKLFDETNTLTTEVEDNQFVLTANSKGLTIYERMLNIIANPLTDTIQFRRERIINRLSTSPPYTLKHLRNVLDQLLGVGNYEIDLVYNDYQFNITTYIGVYGKLDEMLRTLFAILPVNLDKTILNILLEEVESKLYVAQAMDLSIVYTLSSDLRDNYNLDSELIMGQGVDVAKEYSLSSDIDAKHDLQANNQIGSVINGGTIYSIK